MSTELTLPERAKAALKSPDHELALVAMVAGTADITAIKDAAGRTQVHTAYMALKSRRTGIRTAGKDARDDATQFSRAVITEEDRLVALIEPEEKRLQKLRDDYDQERENERREKAAAEQRRKDSIRAKIDEMRHVPLNLADAPADKISTALEDLEALEITGDVFTEFVDAAHAARAEVVGKLKGMHEAAVRRAEHEAQMARERADLERQRAEQAERDRIAAAELARQREEQAERDRQAATAREAQERADRERREAEEARARAEREAEQRKIDEQRADLARQEAELAAERQRIAAEEAARRRAEEEAAATKRREAEEAARAEAERLRAEQEVAAAEAKRRERAQFMQNGPDPQEIIDALAESFFVSRETVLNWLNLHAWAHVEVAA